MDDYDYVKGLKIQSNSLTFIIIGLIIFLIVYNKKTENNVQKINKENTMVIIPKNN